VVIEGSEAAWQDAGFSFSPPLKRRISEVVAERSRRRIALITLQRTAHS
jgi:hypothetical protein